jgi:hypothetical protein
MTTIPEKRFCPLGAECESIKDGTIHKCWWFVRVRGVDKNTGDEVDDVRCALNWLPMLLIENSSMQRSTTVAVESFRNEMVQANEVQQQILLNTVKDVKPNSKLIEG